MHKSKESAAFAEFLAQTFPTAGERAADERAVAKLVAFAELLIALDEVRAGSKISKAELARRIGVKPSVVSRLLDGKGRNVQLDTVRRRRRRARCLYRDASALSAQAQGGSPRAHRGTRGMIRVPPSEFERLIAAIEREARARVRRLSTSWSSYVQSSGWRARQSWGRGRRWLTRTNVADIGNVVLDMSSQSIQLDLRRLRARRQEILGCAAEHGARNVRVFGTTARGETDEASDVDLLVEMQPGHSLLDLVGLWQDLEDMLGTHVDVLSEGGVSPFLREQIFADAVPL